MAISTCSVLEKNYNLPPARPVKSKQDGWTGHTLLLLIGNNAPARQINLSATSLQVPIVPSIRFLVGPLSQLFLETVYPIAQKRKENFCLGPEYSSRVSISFSFHTQTGYKIGILSHDPRDLL